MSQKLKEVKQKIADSIDFRKFTEEFIGDPPEDSHSNHGETELEFICPFHDDTEASFNFNIDKGVWYCFGCGESGDWIDLYMKLENKDFWPAITELGQRLGITVPGDRPGPSLTLQEYSEAMGLDLDLLKNLGLKDGDWYGDHALRVPYWDKEGELFRTRCRRSLYKLNGKDSRFKWYGDGEGQTLYGLWKLPDYDNKVLLVEGESDCHTLWNIWENYPVLGIPGKSNLRNFKKDWIEYLQDFEEITILQENDAKEEVNQAAATLTNETEADIYILDLPTDDVNDLYRTNQEDFKDLWSEAVEDKEKFDGSIELETQSDGKNEKSKHEKLLEIAERVELFRTFEGQMFAEVKEDGKPYIYEIKSKGKSGGQFRKWLLRQYKIKYGETPHSNAITRTMAGLRADCAIAKEKTVYKRIADLGDKILIDLAKDDRRAVEITPKGYEMVENPEKLFWRPNDIHELPEPKGSIKDLKYLRDLFNFFELKEFALLIGWMLATFQTVGPYPVLFLTGEAGAGKSNLTKVVRKLVDPVGSDGKAVAKSIRKTEDLFSVAKHRHIIALDNISRLKKWQSDDLSGIATGGSLEGRKLYTDSGLATIEAMNPIVINGIDISGIGDDLLDRGIFLEVSEPDWLETEEQIWNEFNDKWSELFGGLCEALSLTLANRNEVELTQEEITRMADFTKFLKAAKPAIQKIEDLEGVDPIDVYHENRSSAGRDALQESELGSALVEFLESQEPEDNGVLWQGTTSDLLSKLEIEASEKAINSKSWPGSAVPLGKRLKRLRTTLEKIGIVFEKVDGEYGTINKFCKESEKLPEKPPF